MTIRQPRLASAALLGALALAVSGPAAAMSEAGMMAMTKAGQVMFEHRCRSCHADDPAARSYGPPLVGVIGRKAGSIEGFAYSDAMKASGLVWTEDALRAWMANNDGFMPGTRMRHVGVTDHTEQDFILAYLRTLTGK